METVVFRPEVQHSDGGRPLSDRSEAQAAMTRATQQVLQLIPNADGCVVVLVVGDELVEASRAGKLGPEQIRLSVNESLSGLSFLSGTSFRCDDTKENPFVDHVTASRLGVASFVSVPLRDGIRAIGAFIAVSRDRAAFNDLDVEMLTASAQTLENELAPHAKRTRRFVRS